ncbi:MAG: fructose 1,6-bisphosphatase, partial [Candidatus Methylomirabilales bacterium]
MQAGHITREEFLAQEHERVAKRATITVVSANLLPWLGGVSSLPQEVVEAAHAVLYKAKQKGDIRDFRVYPFGRDLHLQINTLGQGLHNPKVHRLSLEAAAAALARAAEAGLYRPLDGQDFFSLSLRERITALQVRPLEFPLTERGAEPIVIAKLMNGAIGAFNRMLFNLFLHPDKGSH